MPLGGAVTWKKDMITMIHYIIERLLGFTSKGKLLCLRKYVPCAKFSLWELLLVKGSA